MPIKAFSNSGSLLRSRLIAGAFHSHVATLPGSQPVTQLQQVRCRRNKGLGVPLQPAILGHPHAGRRDRPLADVQLSHPFENNAHSARVWLNTQPQLYFPLIMANWPPDFIVSSLRQLTACENVGKHHIFVRVVNADGEGLQDIPVKIYWGITHPTDYAMPITNEAGWIEFAMFRGNYWVEVVAGSSELAGPVTPDIDRDQICDELGFPGNSLYHYSYEIFFTKVK